MKICGLQKLTLLDYPGNLACTVFLGGCNFKCSYCYNTSLINPPSDIRTISVEELMRFLDTRKGILNGVAITGGEPLINKDIKDLILKIREKGFKVKLDTNGSFPDVLENLIEEGLVDYVAMDVKNTYEKYSFTAGAKVNIENISRSINILLQGKVDYEFRTTVIKEFHAIDDFEEIGKMIKGAKHYFLQSFQDKDSVHGHFNAMSKEDLEACLKKAQLYVPVAKIRGVD
ncbi:MAG: anaerobic ribonucleoside-triphosphate reductase activating protein [Bacilli bacterium]|nr:anaerobic ribonucleoside-triphosphate reductase activating protein [Bacilli bacterium]